jgi:hypothetical protein
MSKVYVTYDLEESGPVQPYEVYHGAHEVPIDAQDVLSWSVGEFKRGWGRDVYGVRISFIPSGIGPRLPRQELFEVPANAQNVQVHLGEVPDDYMKGLQSAA